MKTELLKITQDLEQGIITDNEARTILLGLLGVGTSAKEHNFISRKGSSNCEICNKHFVLHLR